MPSRFSVSILMDRSWPIKIDLIADRLRERFPQVGGVDGIPGQTDQADTGIITIDGAQILIESIDQRVPDDDLNPPMKILRPWDPKAVVRTHTAHLRVSCGGRLPGLEGAEAYAAAAHFVAVATAMVAPATGILWNASHCLVNRREFFAQAEVLLKGHMPRGSWISYAPVVPHGYEPTAATGLVTYGLRPFIGRELELAPRPGDAKSAYRCVSTIAQLILDGGLVLHDGQTLDDAGGAFALTVRERTYWLRRDQSAFVLVAADSVVDRDTLQPLARAERMAG
ncbi:MAG: hypothetical protein AAF439_06525 [Pseudomonadota bacterium]